MKFYETHYEEYLQANEKYNLHPEMDAIYEKFPPDIRDFGNLIVYGPCGVGKYTQVLKNIKKYSPSLLKYEKKIKIQTDKQTYVYKISDIHYEIDMGLLGCNSKVLWNEIFQQMVDIISVKQDKKGFIVCKNFHLIHTELLDIFYSYIQQYNHVQSHIQIRFILLTEQVSFIPNNIYHCCLLISIQRPDREQYLQLAKGKISSDMGGGEQAQFIQRINPLLIHQHATPHENLVLEKINPEYILNLKELYSFSLIEDKNHIPNDIFNIICDNIIKEMENPQKIVFSVFRDTIYDILIYNLDVAECIWYILTHFVLHGRLEEPMTSRILKKTFFFLKYFNNNYRPIYHLENIFYYIIIQIQTI